MAGQAKIGAGIALTGEKEFRKAISNINKDAKILSSEMKKVSVQFASNAKSMESYTNKNKVLNKQIDTQKQKITTLTSALYNSEDNYKRAGKNVESWKKKLEEAEKEMQNLKTSSGATEQELEEQGNKIKEISRNLETANKSYDNAESKTKDWKKSIHDTQAELYKLENTVESNEKAIKDLDKPIDTATDSMEDLGDSAEATGKDMLTMGDVIKANVLSAAIIGGVKKLASGVKKIGTEAIKVGMDFQAAMSEVKAISGVAGSEFSMLTDKAKEMGIKTKYSATEAAGAFKYMSMAGWKAADMMQGIEGIMNLAAASGEELAIVSDITTDALTAFGLKAKDSAQFADVLAQASSNSNTNVALMGETFKYVAPVAGALGYTIEDVGVGIGLMANAGVKASMAGTALRSWMTRMAKPTRESEAAMMDLGLSLTDAKGNMLTFEQIMEDTRDGFKDLTKAEKARYAAMLAGKMGMSGLLAVVNTTDEDFKKLTKTINSANGATSRMAKTMNNNLKGDIEILGSSLEGLGIQLFDKFEKPMRKATKSATAGIGEMSRSMERGQLGNSIGALADQFSILTDRAIKAGTEALPSVVDGFTWFLDNSESIATGITTIGIGMATMAVANRVQMAITAYRTMQTTIEGATVAQKLLNAASISNPIGLLTTAVVAAGTAYLGLALKAEKTRLANNELYTSTKNLINETKAWNEIVIRNQEHREETLKTSTAEAEAAQLLSNKIFELNSQEKLSNEEKARMAGWIQTLNELMPGLDATVDEHTGKLKTQKNVIRDLIKANEDLAMAEAAKQQLIEIAKEQLIADQNKLELTEKRAKLEKELIKLKKEHEEAAKEYANTGVSDATTYANYENVRKQLEAVKEEIKKTTESKKKLDKEFDNTSSVLAQRQVSMDIQESLTEVKNAYATTAKKVKEEGGKIEKETKKAFNSAVKEAEKAGVQIPDKIAKGLRDGTISIEEATKLINKAIAKATKETAKENEESGKEINERTAGGIKKYKEAVVKEAKKSIKEAKDGSKKSAQEFTDIGKYMIEGVAKGAKDKSSFLNNAITYITKEALEEAKRSLDIQSPSKKFEKEVGKMIPLGIEQGIKKNKKYAKKSASELSNEVLQKATKWLDNYKVYHKVSLEDEVYYWDKIRKETKKGTQARIDADEKYLEAKRNLKEQEKELEQQAVTDKLNKTKKKLEDYKIYNKTSLKYDMDYWDKSRKEFKKGTEERKELDKLYLDAKKNYTEQMKQLEVDYAKKVKDVSADLKTNTDNLTKTYEDSVKAKTNAIVSSMGLFDKYEAKSEQSKSELTSNLQSQVDGLKSWKKDLEDLGKKGSGADYTAFIDGLEEMGTGAAGQIATINSMSKEELEKYVEMWKEKNKEAKDQALKELEPLREETNKKIKELVSSANKELIASKKELMESSKELGKQITKGFAKGITSTKYLVKDALDDLKKESIKNTKKSNEIKSPSRIYQREVGEHIPSGIEKGIENKTSLIQQSIKKMPSAALKGTEETKIPSLYNTKGLNTSISGKINTSIKNIDFAMPKAPKIQGETANDNLIYDLTQSMVKALKTLNPRVVLNDEKIGELIIDTVTREVFT